MKLVIQIPCWNEEKTIGEVIQSLPKQLPGFDSIESVIIDDGSTDGTAAAACAAGATEVVIFGRHRGLAEAFSVGVLTAIRRGADILVNTDADNQYPSDYIEKIVSPILESRADIVVGNRLSWQPPPFKPVKLMLERTGSVFVRFVSGANALDATSGFRAFSREVMERLFIHARFSYTLESLFMAGRHHFRIINIPIPINKTKRKSRLAKNIPSFIGYSLVNIVRAYLLYHPLRFFVNLGLFLIAAALVLGMRFIWYFIVDDGSGHVQSLLLMAVLAIAGFQSIALGFLGDVISANRRLLEDMRIRQLKSPCVVNQTEENVF
jgi:glycosyltransferase involved in cell wall biosynthesis